GQVLQQPHAVVFDDDAACARLLFQVGQVLGVQLGFIFQHPDAGAGEGELLGLVLHFAFLADQKQGLVRRVKISVLTGLLDTGSLAASEESTRQYYRHFLCRTRDVSLPSQQPNPAAMPSSPRLQPMTTSLPPTPA